MAVNVNTVYKTTLLILNKEQRGYITPNEFNRISVQVQREILEQYFEELNQQLRVPQNNDEYANRVNNLQEKIDIFQKFDVCTGTNPFTLPTDVHRLGMLAYREKEIQEINRRDYLLVNRSALTTPTTSNPVYILEGTGSPSSAPSKAYVYPDTITTGADVTAYYVKTPIDPRWGYSVGALGQYVYDSTIYGDSLINTGDSTLTSSADTAGLTATNTTSPIALTQGAGATGNFALTPVTGPGGTGLEISVSVASNVFTINVTSAGTGYVVGDILAIPATAIPGLSGQIVITLVASDFNNNSTYGSTDFELHPSEQPNIIMNILLYCGVVIRDPQIVQNAAQMIAQDEALEKS